MPSDDDVERVACDLHGQWRPYCANCRSTRLDAAVDDGRPSIGEAADADHVIYNAVVIEQCGECNERTVGGIVHPQDSGMTVACIDCGTLHDYGDVVDARSVTER